MGKSDAELSKVHKRATWLNANVFQISPIDEEAIRALHSLGLGRAFEICKEVEAKAAEIGDPSTYIKGIALEDYAKMEGGGGEEGAPPRALNGASSPQLDATWEAPTTKGHDQRGGQGFVKLHKRISWLNANVFPESPISDDVIEALHDVGLNWAFDLLRDLESKAASMRNPDGYLMTAIRREIDRNEQAHAQGYSGEVDEVDQGSLPPPPPPPLPPPSGGGRGRGKESQESNSKSKFSKVHKRITWLNGNVFQANPIRENAMQALLRLNIGRAYEILKEMESKPSEIRNPTAYVITAARTSESFALDQNEYYDAREGPGVSAGYDMGPPPPPPPMPPMPWGLVQTPVYPPMHAPPPSAPPVSRESYSKVHKRATWLNAHVFRETPISEEVVEAMAELGLPRAFELFREIEGKSDSIRNPSGYLLNAWKRESQQPRGGHAAEYYPPPMPMPYPPPPPLPFSYPGPGMHTRESGGNGHGNNDDREASKIHKRITWLNSNVFQSTPIDEEARQALYSVGIGRAFELLKDVETKVAEIRNPGGYLKNAVKKDLGRGGPPRTSAKRGGEDWGGGMAKRGREQ